MKKRLITLSFACIGLLNSNIAQNNQKDLYPNSLYESGKELFQERIYSGSIRALEEFVRASKDEQLVAEAKFLILYSETELNQENAVERIKEYMRIYPVTIHQNRLKFLLASAYYNRKNYAEAIEWFDKTDMDQLSNDEQELFFYRLGYAKLEQKEYKTALTLFSALESDSRQFRDDATYYIAYINYCEKKFDKALAGFKRLNGIQKYEKDIAYYTLQIQYLNKKYGEAVSSGKKLLTKYPNHPSIDEVYRIVGGASYHLEDYKSAIKYLGEYHKLNPNPLRNDMYLLAMSYYQTENFQKALEFFSLSTSGQDEVSQSAYLYIGQCALRLGDKNKARMSFEAASRFDFNMQVKEQAMYNYGLIIHETSFSPFNESLVVFERFLNLFPNSTYADKVNDYMVETYLTTRNYDAALTSISKIKSPSNKILGAKQNILFQLGSQKFANSDFKGALDFFNQSLQLSSYNSDVKAKTYFWRGETYYRMEDYNKAIADYQTYFSTNRSANDEYYHLAHYNIAYSYMKLQRVGEAQSWFNKYVGFSSEQSKPSFADALNRIGDCYYYQRNWPVAENYYNQAATANPEAGDYAVFQKAFVLGLRKQYNEKITMLNALISNYPKSDYVDDAIYEKGRAYVMLNQNQEAISEYNELMRRFPESNLSRKAGNQIGLLYYNSNNLEAAAAAYKNVISKYSGSQEARTALEDLKSVYVELDKVSEFADFANSVGDNMQVTEQDSLTYLSAERLLMRGDSKAKQSLENYIERFPNGAYRTDAAYYLGNIFYDNGDKQAAYQQYVKVIERESAHTEIALARCADITFMNHQYDQSLNFFQRLAQKAEKKDNKDAAKLGILRCSYNLKRHQEVVEAASNLLTDSKLSPELKLEAHGLRANAYVALGDENKAVNDLKQVTSETRTVYGAEANYQLANIYFKKGNLDQAEKVIFAFVEKGTPHQYWMARCFILLSDIYVKKGDEFSAREYLNSLKENYKEEDDIQGMINSRMSKLNSQTQPVTHTAQ